MTTPTKVNKKVCTVCNKLQSFSDYVKDIRAKDGLSSSCKYCDRVRNKAFYRTKNGLMNTIFRRHKYRSKIIEYTPPSYTKEELKDWLLSQPNFDKLYKDWVESGYLRNLSPSVDRKDDYKGYSFENIQLMTWKENKEKYDYDKINGINTKQCKSVSQYNLNGKFIKSYYSMEEAGRKTGIFYQNISCVCRGVNKTAGGFKWKY